MKTKNQILSAAALLLATQTLFGLPPIGTAFTYQGRLMDGGQPANGNYDLSFHLCDASTNGAYVGAAVYLGPVGVTNGLFTVELNANNEFGSSAFNGSTRWLEISTRTNNNNANNNFVLLTPRQPLTLTPQATFAVNAMNASFAANVADGAITSSKFAPGALSWAGLAGIPAGFADGIDNDTTYAAGTGLSLGGTNQFSVNFAGTGVANTAARSDHGHFGATFGGSAQFVNGLSVTNGAPNSSGLYGQQGAGSGFPYVFGNIAGVWGESSQGNGVYGASGNASGHGVFGYAVSTNGANSGVHGATLSPAGAGVSAYGSGTNGTALRLSNGALRVTGAGLNTATPAFIQVATAANMDIGHYSTTIDNPYCNNDPNAILIVTPIIQMNTFAPHVALFYDDGTYGYATNRWILFASDSSLDPFYNTIKVGSRYSVLVIKP